MTRAFNINDLDHDVDVEYLTDEEDITLSKYNDPSTELYLSKSDLMKIFLLAVEAGLIDRKEAIINLAT